MKYLVRDSECDEQIFISGETKKEIIIKALQKYLTDNWSDDLMTCLENSFDLAFIDITNIEEL
jgi:hypothetical protein